MRPQIGKGVKGQVWMLVSGQVWGQFDWQVSEQVRGKLCSLR